MTDNILIKAVCISLAGHISIFSLFNFSFGKRVAPGDYSSVAFWGGVLSGSQIRPEQENRQGTRVQILARELNPRYPASTPDLRQAVIDGLKPQQPVAFCEEKVAADTLTYSEFSPSQKKEQAIFFHPILPQNFFLYFTDRQVAHVELAFKAQPRSYVGPMDIKRKISSGNLEVDLLTMRYMSHYFFIHPGNFRPNTWQTIKIDLSAGQQE